VVASSGSASACRPSGRLSVSAEEESTSAHRSLVSAQSAIAEAGFTPAQARETSSLQSPEEGGSWGKHRFPHATGRAAGRLNAPRPALVETGPGATPRIVNREQVTLVREEWRVVDRWWTDEPVDRHYYDVVLEGGRNVCVYRDAEAQCWFTQQA
jgi:hypothetical protein